MSCGWSLAIMRKVMSFHLHTMVFTSNPTEWLEEEISYRKAGIQLSYCSPVFSLKIKIMLAILPTISHVSGFINYSQVMGKIVEIH